MAAKGYTNKEKIEAYLLIEIEETFDDQIDRWIETAEKIIEEKTKRVFIADSTSSEKTYETKNKQYVGIGDYISSPKNLYVDDFINTAKLTIDGELIDEDDFLVYPVNENPKTRICYPDGFSQDRQNIKVEARWGYSLEVPADIEFATTVIVAGIIQHSLSHEGEIASVSMGRYSVSYKDEKQMKDFESVKEILNRYKKIL
jgi:hypothetical protein